MAIVKLPANANDVAEIVRNLLSSEEGDAELYQATWDNELTIDQVLSFDQAGVMSQDEGVVVKLSDGQEFTITVKRSR